MAERFSVVTISFNQAPFLEDTIRSVLSQAGDFILDYLVIDGGSTDGSIDIIKGYQSQLLTGRWSVSCQTIEYRWLSEPDPGPTFALNKGLRLTRGEFVSLLNSDDVYPPGTLALVTKLFQENPAVDVIYGDTV
ncbi:MAG: glycosyltransferase, partial [Candidatus Omnitrophica bacterium]|nr:glycosyltransferase [Candidatus Omnitrophota bacterium]